MNYDARELDTELRAAGLEIHGCDGTGRIHWVRPPTAQEQVTAQAVLAAHDPGARERRGRAELDELARLHADLEAAVPATVAEWNALTPAQRNEALWRGLRIQWRCARTMGPP